MGGPLPLALTLLAVMGLIGLVHLAGFVAQPSLDGMTEAAELARGLPGGFVATEVALAEDGRGALLCDAQGRVAVVAPLGAHFVVRLRDQDWRVAREFPGQLSITGRDFSCSLRLGAREPPWLGAFPHSGAATT